MSLKTKTTLATFFGLLIFHEIVSGAPLRVRAFEWVVLIIAFLIPAILIPNRTRVQKFWILSSCFTLGLAVQILGASITVLKFELHWGIFALVPIIFVCFGLLQILNEGIFFVATRFIRHK